MPKAGFSLHLAEGSWQQSLQPAMHWRVLTGGQRPRRCAGLDLNRLGWHSPQTGQDRMMALHSMALSW